VEKDILFLDENAITRNFEPLLSKKKCLIGIDHEHIINITTYKKTKHG